VQEARAAYAVLVSVVVNTELAESSRRAAALELLGMRAAGTADNSCHLHAVRASGVTHGGLTHELAALLLPRGGDVAASRAEGGTQHRRAGDKEEEEEEEEAATAVTERCLRELAALRQWAEFAQLADADGDGDIDFGEFVSILTLLELSSEEVELAFRAFDADSSGFLDEEEAGRLIRALGTAGRVGSQVRDRGIAQGDRGRVRAATSVMVQRMKQAVEHSKPPTAAAAAAAPTASGTASTSSSGRAAAGSSTSSNTGTGGSGLTLAELLGFHGKLVSAVRRAEFAELDVDGSGSLSRAEFARLFASRVSPPIAEAMLARADRLIGGVTGAAGAPPSTAETENDPTEAHAPARITVREMGAVDTLLDRHARLGLALRAAAQAEGSAGGAGAISRAGFRRACRAVLRSTHAGTGSAGTGSDVAGELTPAQEEVIVALLDEDGDGCVSAGEVTAALHSAASHDLDAVRGRSPLLSGLVRAPRCLVEALAANP
jgi:Ca2+-binding EF-hand superfamily protein